jgi:hypothetical protein
MTLVEQTRAPIGRPTIGICGSARRDEGLSMRTDAATRATPK